MTSFAWTPDILKRLRQPHGPSKPDAVTAADHIEALEAEVERLRAFKAEIIKLMINHDSLTVHDDYNIIPETYAVVYPARIAEVLDKLGIDWK
jgi:hypothetical protein